MKFMGQEVLGYEDYESEVVYYLADGSMVIQPKNVSIPTSLPSESDIPPYFEATDAMWKMYYGDEGRTAQDKPVNPNLNRAGRRAQERAQR